MKFVKFVCTLPPVKGEVLSIEEWDDDGKTLYSASSRGAKDGKGRWGTVAMPGLDLVMVNVTNRLVQLQGLNYDD